MVEAGYNFVNSADFQNFKTIKEKLCYVVDDYDA